MLKSMSALLGASLLVITAPSDAALYDITYTGMVSSGYDQTGVFLGQNTDLAGQAFTAVFTLNYPVPSGAYEYDDGQTHYAYGGDNYSTGTPSFLSGKITINGKTDTVSGQYVSYPWLQNLPGQDYLWDDSEDYDQSDPNKYSYSYIQSWIQSTNDNYLTGSSLTQNVNYVADSNDSVGGYFSFDEHDANTGVYEKYAYGYLSPSSVTVSVSAVPEQSTWAMMITAFGFAGTAFRRRKSDGSHDSRQAAGSFAQAAV